MEKQEDVAAATHRQSKIAWRILEGLLLLQLHCAVVVVVVAHKPRGSAQGFVKPTCPVRKALSSTHIRKESVSMSIQDGSPSTSQRLAAIECKIHNPCTARMVPGHFATFHNAYQKFHQPIFCLKESDFLQNLIKYQLVKFKLFQIYPYATVPT